MQICFRYYRADRGLWIRSLPVQKPGENVYQRLPDAAASRRPDHGRRHSGSWHSLQPYKRTNSQEKGT